MQRLRGTARQELVGGEPAACATASPVLYLLAILSGGVAAFTAVLAFLVFADEAGYLPPPTLTNNLCLDEKLRFLREEAPQNATLLVGGSSIALFNFAGEPFYAASGGKTVPLNLGLCGLRINQVAFAMKQLAPNYPLAREAFIFVAAEDFRDCAKARMPPFEPKDVDDYIHRRDLWPNYFFFKYWSPVSLLRNMRSVAEGTGRNTVPLDRFGGHPSESRRDPGSYEWPEVDEACFGDLRRMAELLASRMSTLFVISPMHPGWSEQHGSDGSERRRFYEAVARTLAGTGARLWNAQQHVELRGDHFSDALHLNSAGAEAFATRLLQADAGLPHPL
jgi:hypothetical protein